MVSTTPTRVGIMGFGQVGRQIYDLAANSDDIVVTAIADIGQPDILHYLLCSEVDEPDRYQLQGNFLVNDRFKTRVAPIDRPAEMPWDMFGVDVVIDATGKYRSGVDMGDHLGSGAPRVLLRTLPIDDIDRIVMPGINEASIQASDRMISAGSATTTALCLLLKILGSRFDIECGNMTSIHSYTSDQALQDYAGSDFRRSRSAATNIIPNQHDAGQWIGRVLPEFEGKFLTSALNVPIHQGCLLDTTLVINDENISAEAVNQAVIDSVTDFPGIVDVVADPIVSSDVIGSSLSLLFDLKGTLKAGEQTLKTLCWYEHRGHAARLLDVVRLYARLDNAQEAA